MEIGLGLKFRDPSKQLVYVYVVISLRPIDTGLPFFLNLPFQVTSLLLWASVILAA